MRGPSTHRDARPTTTAAYPERVTYDDLAEIGAALLNAAAGMAVLGHESPAGLASYVNPGDMPSWHARFVLDMVAFSQGVARDEEKERALDRLYGFAWQSGAVTHVSDAAAS